MRKVTMIIILIMASFLLIGCNAKMVAPGSAPEASPTPTAAETPLSDASPTKTAAETPLPEASPTPTIAETLPPEPSMAKIRLSDELYMPEISVTGWKPYFTGEEPEWLYNPDEPWAWNRDGENSFDQTAATDAHMSLYPYLESYANYAGCYVNSNGYLTVMLTEPTIEQADEISGRSAAPIWIVASQFSYGNLRKALDEVFPAITSWMDEHPEAPIGGLSGGIHDDVNRVYINLSGSGIPQLLEAFDFPECINLVYTLTIDPSLSHDLPRAPVTAWEKDGATIKCAQESYPVGTTSLRVTASHDAPKMRMYAPDAFLSVEKYVDGEWYDVSGNFFSDDVYAEILDIPAGVEKTVNLEIATPETLGPGLYRATYNGFVWLSPTGDWDMNCAIAGIGGRDNVSFEFAIS